MRRREEQAPERVEPAEVQEEEPLQVNRPDLLCQLVRERVQRVREEVARDGHREAVEVVRRGKGVRDHRVDGRLREDERI